MGRGGQRAYRVIAALMLVAGAVSLMASPASAPAIVLVGLLCAARSLVRAWYGARGTALRPAVGWSALAVMLAVASQAAAVFEPLVLGRPTEGHLTYLSSLATLAALIAVLGARTPGVGAWTILMGLLILVFLIPWLEGPGLGRGPNALARLRLDQPWALFYALLVVAGVTNYLPTRYGLAAAWLGLGFVLEYVSLTRAELSPATRATLWSAVQMTLSLALFTADVRARALPWATSRMEAIWFRFRDHWGVVWALRVQERFNRSAEAQRWPIRLAWHGVVTAASEETAVVPEGAVALLKTLIRRFADPARLDTAVASLPPSQTD